MFRMSRLFMLLKGWEKWALPDGKTSIREQQRNPMLPFAPGLGSFSEFRKEWLCMPTGALFPPQLRKAL